MPLMENSGAALSQNFDNFFFFAQSNFGTVLPPKIRVISEKKKRSSKSIKALIPERIG